MDVFIASKASWAAQKIKIKNLQSAFSQWQFKKIKFSASLALPAASLNAETRNIRQGIMANRQKKARLALKFGRID
jgi:hypothetical protein